MRLDVMKQVAHAYVGVLAAQERVALNEKLLDVARRARAAVAQRVEAGKDAPVEELRASVALSQSEIEAKKATNALATARQALAAAMGRETVEFKEATGDFYTAPPAPSFDDAAEAVAGSPDIERWAAEERKQRAAVDLEKAKVTPDVTISGGMRYFEEGDDAAMVMGVALPIPLFNRNQGNIRRAQAELAAARNEVQRVHLELQQRLAAVFEQYTTARYQVEKYSRDILPNARASLDLATKGYRQGEYNYLFLLTAQRTYFQTNVTYLDSLRELRAAATAIEGNLLDGSLQTGDAGDHDRTQ